ncbi:MAG: hypothetical protein EOP04_07205 [Proteobacteria bacterium]|nr:MAG: hypothetical protein EOP04_07205 [Pseudomonadota bacterium]
MIYQFYADIRDKVEILDFLLRHSDMRIFDLYSHYGKEIRQYQSVEEITGVFDLENGGLYSASFQLWAPTFGKAPEFVRVTLDPKRCNGHTFRYRTAGLGLIQFHLGGITKGHLEYSQLIHFSEKGALKAEGSDSADKSEYWNWKEISKASKALQNHIKKHLLVGKLNGLDILRGANETLALRSGGTVL